LGQLFVLQRFYSVALIDHLIEICLQLFKGKFHYCKEAEYPTVVTKEECLREKYTWENKEYNFDNLAKVNCHFVLFCFALLCVYLFRLSWGVGERDKTTSQRFLAQLRCPET